MKWFFFILLLINLGLFLLIYPQYQDGEVLPVLPDVGELKLAHEQPLLLASNVDRTDESLVAEDDADSLPHEDGGQNTVSVSPEEPQQPQGLPQSVPNEPEQSSSVEEETQDEPTMVIPSVQPPSCTVIGYVDTRLAAEQISVRLRALNLKPELQSETRNEQAGYWVLIPPQATRREAIMIAKQLEQAGVTDLWRFTSGNLVRAISLGLFRDELRAADRKREIDALGFETVIKPRYREKTSYWLSYQTTAPSPLSEQNWAGLLKDFPELELSSVDCP
jgi:hypothetical protein